jgi:ribosomal protein S7
MSRRRRPEKRVILPDPKFGDQTLSKFMNNLMLDGKKSVAESIVYGALETMEARAKSDPIQLFHDALNNVKPQIEVRSRRVGGATYQVPCRSASRTRAGSGHPLVDHRCAQPQRNHDGCASVGRAARCCQQPWQRGQEA